MMPVFRFRMQSMLELREQLEKNMMNRMAYARRKLENEQDILKLFENEESAAKENYNSSTTKGLTVCDIKRFGTYISYLNEKVERQADIVKQHARNADKIREDLVKAMQEKKTMEKLREKKYVEFKKEEKRKEQSVVDELVSYKGSKKAREA